MQAVRDIMASTYGTGTGDGERQPSVYQQHETQMHISGDISKFSLYLKIVGAAELVITVALMANVVWFANFTGLVLGVMAIQGARLQKRDLTFTHMVLAVLEFAKNVGMVIFFVQYKDRSAWEDATIGLAVLDNVTLLPAGGFFAYKLWLSLRRELGMAASGAPAV